MKLKYFFEKFKWMKVYFSPFKPPSPRLYIGKVAIGTPYFYPRRWVRSDKPGYKKPVPKKIGFDFVGLGYKTKWSDTDYRFEWTPVWSFVFFKWQVAIIFKVPETSHFWECWLYYSRNTKGTTEQRIRQAKKEFPCIWTSYKDGTETEICYWDVILKNYNYD